MSNQSQNQDQHSRTERARYALNHHQFTINQTSTFNWKVQNGNKQPYLVSKELNKWVCSCEDFVRNRNTGIRCKHIEAIRLSHESTQTSHSEAKKPFRIFPHDPHDIVTALSQRLDMTRVKRRKAPGGSVPYLEGYDIIEQANSIFEYQWSFSLLSEPNIMRWEKQQMIYDQVKRKRIPLKVDGQNVMETVGIVYITGKIVVILGDKLFEHADIGRCTFTGDTPEALDMATAGCATDCLKRCFRQMGNQFGNSLYNKEVAKIAGTSQTIHQDINQRLYRDGKRVNGNINEQKAFDRFVKVKHGIPPATREELRIWLKESDKKSEQELVAELGFAAN